MVVDVVGCGWGGFDGVDGGGGAVDLDGVLCGVGGLGVGDGLGVGVLGTVVALRGVDVLGALNGVAVGFGFWATTCAYVG